MILNYIPDGKSSSMSALAAKIDPSKIAKSTGDDKNKKKQQPAGVEGEDKKPSKKELKKAAKKEQKKANKGAAKGGEEEEADKAATNEGS